MSDDLIALAAETRAETTINELDPVLSLSGTETLAASNTNNEGFKVTLNQINDFVKTNAVDTALEAYDDSEAVNTKISTALENYDTSNEVSGKINTALADYDNSTTVNEKITNALSEYDTSTEVTGKINTALEDYDTSTEVDTKIASASSGYNAATCSTAAGTAQKTVTIENFTLEPGKLIGIIFTNGNSYGETTASTPTYPTLKINNGTAYPICDSRGHYAGKGFCNAGDYIELRFTGDKFCIVNSDIRESVQDSSSGYTIKSNNKIEQWGVKSCTFIYGYNTSNNVRLSVPMKNYDVQLTMEQSSLLDVRFIGYANRNNTNFDIYSYMSYNTAQNSININYRCNGEIL